jgi:cysteine-rich repeat protein
MSFDGSALVMDATTTTVGPMGSGAGTAGSPEICPSASLAISLTGSAGAVLDLVGLGCGVPVHTLCGDGMQQGAESCDDGNVTSGDGCSATCVQEP